MENDSVGSRVGQLNWGAGSVATMKLGIKVVQTASYPMALDERDSRTDTRFGRAASQLRGVRTAVEERPVISLNLRGAKVLLVHFRYVTVVPAVCCTRCSPPLPSRRFSNAAFLRSPSQTFSGAPRLRRRPPPPAASSTPPLALVFADLPACTTSSTYVRSFFPAIVPGENP